MGKPGMKLNTVTDVSLSGLGLASIDDIPAPKLSKLNLTKNEFTNAGIRGIANLSSLTMLNLSMNKLTTMKHLESLTSLRGKN